MQAIDKVELQIKGEWVKLLADVVSANALGLACNVDADQADRLRLLRLNRDLSAQHSVRIDGEIKSCYLSVSESPIMVAEYAMKCPVIMCFID